VDVGVVQPLVWPPNWSGKDIDVGDAANEIKIALRNRNVLLLKEGRRYQVLLYFRLGTET
jgi:hypothetical protein